MLFPRRGGTRLVSGEEKKCNEACCLIIMAIIMLSVPAALIYYEGYFRETLYAFDEVKPQLNVLHSDQNIIPELNGRPVYLNSKQIVPNTVATDADFNVAFGPNTVKLNRQTEYCQWVEYSSDKTYKDSQGREYTERTYWYQKRWVPTPLISVLYNQPFAHFNPLRDPFPSYTRSVEAAKAGVFTLTTSLIDRISNGFETIHFNPNELSGSLLNSPAGAAHNFRYIGNGYFYSAYEFSGAHIAARLFGQFLEGSLNFQLADLFSSCNAGDIRVHFEAVNPKSISLIGKQMPNGELIPFETTRGFSLGLISVGDYSADQLFENEIGRLKWIIWGLRIVLVIFVIVGLKGTVMSEHSWLSTLGASACLSICLLTSALQIVWGFNLIYVLSSLLGLVGTILLVRSLPDRIESFQHNEKEK